MGLSNWGVDMTIFLPPLGRMVLSDWEKQFTLVPGQASSRGWPPHF